MILKKENKPFISGAIVYMPRGFVKPINYPIELIILYHPTLRDYLVFKELTEVDPNYDIYPNEKPRFEPRDEISLRN